MANSAIQIRQKDTGINVSVVDTTANIHTLWTTAQTLVDGYMDFTSVGLGYAQYAQVYDDNGAGNFLNTAGEFSGKGGTLDNTRTFDLGINVPGFTTGSIPEAYTIRNDTVAHAVTDTQAALVTIATQVNEQWAALINAGIIRQAAS